MVSSFSIGLAGLGLGVDAAERVLQALSSPAFAPLEDAVAWIEAACGQVGARSLVSLVAFSLPHALAFRLAPSVAAKTALAVSVGTLQLHWLASFRVAAWTLAVLGAWYAFFCVPMNPTLRKALVWLGVVSTTVWFHWGLVANASAFHDDTKRVAFLPFLCGMRLVSLACNLPYLQHSNLRRDTLAQALVVVQAGNDKRLQTAKLQKNLLRRLSLARGPFPSCAQFLAWMLHPGAGMTGCFQEFADYHAALHGKAASTDVWHGFLAGKGVLLSSSGISGAAGDRALEPLARSAPRAARAAIVAGAGILAAFTLQSSFDQVSFALGEQGTWLPWWRRLYSAFPDMPAAAWSTPTRLQQVCGPLWWAIKVGFRMAWTRGFVLGSWLPALALAGRVVLFQVLVMEPAHWGWWKLGECLMVLSGIGYTPSAALDCNSGSKVARRSEPVRVAFTAAPTLAVPRVLLNGWSASTATPVFAMHFMGSFRDAIRCWNPRMSWWLEHYVHREVPQAWGLNYLVTYGANALMHGSHLGSWFTYSTFILLTVHERTMQQLAELCSGAIPWRVGKTASRLLMASQVFLLTNYAFMTYTIKPWPIALLTWAEIGFLPHAYIFTATVLGIIVVQVKLRTCPVWDQSQQEAVAQLGQQNPPHLEKKEH